MRWSHISRILRDRMPARSDRVAIGAALLGVPVAFLLLSVPTQAVPWLFRAALASGAFGVLTLGVRWWFLRLFQRDLDEGLVPGATLMWRLAWMHACHLVAWRLGLLTLSLGLLSVTLLLLGNAGSGGVVCIVLAGFSLTALTPPPPMEPHRLALGALVPIRPPNADLACSQVFLLPRRLAWVTDEDATRTRHRGRPSLLSAIHANFRFYRESGRSSLPLYAARYRPDDRAEARAVGLAGFCYLRYALILALLLVALGFPFLGPADDAPMAGAPLALAPTGTSSDPESYPESSEEAPAETAADTTADSPGESPAESGGGAAGQSVSGAGSGEPGKPSGDGSETDGDDVSGPGSDQGPDVAGSGSGFVREGAGGGAARRGEGVAEPDANDSQSTQSGDAPSEGASGRQGGPGAGPGQGDPGNPNTGTGDGGGTQLPGPGDPGPAERPQSAGGGDRGSQGAEEAGSGSERAGSDGRDPQKDGIDGIGPQSAEREPGGSHTAAADGAGSGGKDGLDGERVEAVSVDGERTVAGFIVIDVEEAATLGKDFLEIEGLQAAYGAKGGTVADLREFELSDDPFGRTEPVANPKPPVQHLPAWIAELLASP